MPATAKPARNSNRIAVIRNYQPSRIERELLAQVFDLAQRDPADGSAHVGTRSVSADKSPCDLTQRGLANSHQENHAHTPEAVA